MDEVSDCMSSVVRVARQRLNSVAHVIEGYIVGRRLRYQAAPLQPTASRQAAQDELANILRPAEATASGPVDANQDLAEGRADPVVPRSTIRQGERVVSGGHSSRDSNEVHKRGIANAIRHALRTDGGRDIPAGFQFAVDETFVRIVCEVVSEENRLPETESYDYLRERQMLEPGDFWELNQTVMKIYARLRLTVVQVAEEVSRDQLPVATRVDVGPGVDVQLAELFSSFR